MLRAADEKREVGRENVEENRFWNIPVPAPTFELEPELRDWVSVRSEIILRTRRSRSKLRGSVVAVAYEPVALALFELAPELEDPELQFPPPLET